MNCSKRRRQIWIAGAGISASLAALRLLRLGHSVVLWSASKAVYKAVESTSAGFYDILRELEVDDCLWECGACSVDRTWCFERSSLAALLLQRACNAGADVREVRKIPNGGDGTCDALIDATGRVAAWSGRVRRYGREIADLYELSVGNSPSDRQLVASDWFWAYRLATASAATAAVITRHGQNTVIAAEQAFEKLNISPVGVRFVGRRFCSPQWAEKAICGNRISIGDAVFAHYPLAGMGVRFAAATAMAAAAVLQTRWERPENSAIADDYYIDLCEAARRGHLANLTGSRALSPQPSPHSEAGRLVFRAHQIEAGVLRGDVVVPDKVFLLADGSRVRWLGRVDLAAVRECSLAPVDRTQLLERLASVLGRQTDVPALIDWCIRRQVLCECKL